MPVHERSSCENRRGPSERSWTSSAVHLAPMISAQAATAHVVDSCTGFIVRATVMRLIVVKASAGERAGAGVDPRDREARDRSEAARSGLAGLGDACIAR